MMLKSEKSTDKLLASQDEETARIETTPEEMEGFFIVKSIVRTSVEPERIGHRDTQSYFGILLDDNNRKPVCRLHFNRSQKYLGIWMQIKRKCATLSKLTISTTSPRSL
jgi:hypothetical protein